MFGGDTVTWKVSLVGDGSVARGCSNSVLHEVHGDRLVFVASMALTAAASTIIFTVEEYAAFGV